MNPEYDANAERPVRFLELWTPGPWQIKVYGITFGGETPDEALVQAAKEASASIFENWQNETAGFSPTHLGILGVHQGNGFSVVFPCCWANENEFFQEVLIAPLDQPGGLAPDPRRTACIYDIALIAFEREAFVTTMLRNPDGPDREAYLGAVLNREV
jgi:hypothetical protein